MILIRAHFSLCFLLPRLTATIPAWVLLKQRPLPTLPLVLFLKVTLPIPPPTLLRRLTLATLPLLFLRFRQEMQDLQAVMTPKRPDRVPKIPTRRTENINQVIRYRLRQVNQMRMNAEMENLLQHKAMLIGNVQLVREEETMTLFLKVFQLTRSRVGIQARALPRAARQLIIQFLHTMTLIIRSHD